MATALIADDDAVTLGIVAQTLQRLGYTVTLADDGDELLQQIAEHPFDLLVTDVSMPWMTGLQVVHSARAAGLATPLVVMTGLALDPEVVASLGPCAVLLRKPFGARQLAAAVTHVIREGSHVHPGS